MQRVAMLSVHTSPLAQPGTGDGGGMNVYVRALAAALARAGVAVDVLTRAEHPDQPPCVEVEPGFRVLHVPAGPCAPVPLRDLPELVGEFTDVRARCSRVPDVTTCCTRTTGCRARSATDSSTSSTCRWSPRSTRSSA